MTDVILLLVLFTIRESNPSLYSNLTFISFNTYLIYSFNMYFYAVFFIFQVAGYQ
jgi:hypothetical protein